VCLAPVYVTAIQIAGQEAQAYVFAVPATERSYLPLAREGKEPPIPPIRRVARPTRSAERVAAI
jgi:hypothetical protein